MKQILLLSMGLLAATLTVPASTIWNGPNIGFYHPFGGGGDAITTGVVITRGSSGGLYNSASESGPTGGVSPAGTTWAVGTLANYSTLTYGPCPLEAGGHPPGDINKTYVVHLTASDIYLQLTLTNWGGAGSAFDQQTFGYTRSTAPVSPPSISITNPLAGAVRAAPATFTIQASATSSGASVTNVQFYTNTVLYGSVTTAPFNFTANNLPAGSYALTAAATAAGVSATSAVVNLSVVTPVSVTLSNSVKKLGTNFQFNYSANVGLSYVIQKSTTLNPVNWIPLVTNLAASNPVVFTDTQATNTPAFYRVGRMPNP